MSIKTYSTIAESYNINNYFDMYDDNFNKIRFSITDQQLFITSYNASTGTWSPATVIFDNSPIQTTSIVDLQDLILANNVRVQLDANIPANGTELLTFEKINNYNYIKRSGLNYAIQNSPYLPTSSSENRLVVYKIDSNGKPQLTLDPVSTTNFKNTFITINDDQTVNSVKTFNANKLVLGGTGGNVTLNGSQTTGSSSYTLEWPTAAPSGALNVLTTSGSSPYSKYTWTDLSNYTLASSFNQLSALNTTGSPTFANLTIASGGALNLNYMSTPASSDIIATLNTNKQLTNSGIALSSLCTLGTAQTITADKTFNYSAGKIKLSNYSTDNTTTNNLLTLNSSGYIVPCNKLYSDISPFSTSTAYTFTAKQTFNATSNPVAINNLTKSISTDSDVLLSLDTSGNVKKTDILYNQLSPLSDIKIPIYHFKFQQNLSSSGSASYTPSNTISSPTYNASGKYGYCFEPKYTEFNGGFTALNNSSGNDFCMTGWVRVNATGKSLRIRFDNTFGDQVMEFMMSDIVMPQYVGNGAQNGFDLRRFASDIDKSQWVQTTNPNFNNASDINKWWFFGFTWNSSTTTLSMYISDGGSNKYLNSQSYPTKSSTFNTLFRYLGAFSFMYTTDGTFVDDIRIYNSVLSTAEMDTLAQSSVDTLIYPKMLLDSTAQTISGSKIFNSNTLLLNGGGAANVTLNAPSISSAYTWTLPSSNPSSGTTNVLTTTSTSSPYTLSWTDLASTYLTLSNASSTYLTQANAGTTYMKLNATQTNSGTNTWSGNNTFNQDKLLLPALTATASGTYVLTKNASTGAVEYASSVAWNNINLINSAQTITAVKTYDYTTAKIALTNTTNDTTSTNKVLVLNASNQIVPCDKTYANIGSGGGGSTVTNGYALLQNPTGNRQGAILVTNPYSSTSVTVTANISKTTNNDNNYVIFNDITTNINSSTITFNISADSDWVVDANNTYTLFYAIMQNPATNQSYSYDNVVIPNLYAYCDFEAGTFSDTLGKFTNLTINDSNYSKVSTIKKWGTYGWAKNQYDRMDITGTNFTNLGKNITFSLWCRANVNGTTITPPDLSVDWGQGVFTRFKGTSLNTTPPTMTLSWGITPVVSSAVSLDSNFHLYTFVINNTNGTAKFYFDGSLLLSTTISNFANGAIGSYFSYYEGSTDLAIEAYRYIIDDLRIYSRCLTDGEITMLYSTNPVNISTTSNYYASVGIPNLLCYWPLNSSVTCNTSNISFTGTPTYNTTTFKYGTSSLDRTSATLTANLSSFTSFNGITISVWANFFTNALLTLNPAALTELNINTTNNTGTTIQVGLSGGTLASSQYSAAVPYSSSNWYNIVVYIDLLQKVVKIYYNGTSILTYTGSDSYFAAASWTAPVISLNKNGSANLDDLRVYSRLLTDTEIRNLYSYNPTAIYAPSQFSGSVANTYTATQTFSAASTPLAITNLSTAATSDRLMTVNTSTGAVTNSNIALSNLSNSALLTSPVYQFILNGSIASTGTTTSYSTTGSFSTYIANTNFGTSSAHINSQSGNCFSSALTALNNASGKDITISGRLLFATNGSFQFYHSTSSPGGTFDIRFQVNGTDSDYATFYFNELSGAGNDNSVNISRANFNVFNNKNIWLLWAATFTSATNTLAFYISNGTTSFTATKVISTANSATALTNITNAFRNISNAYFASTSGSYTFDNRYYSSALTTAELDVIAAASSTSYAGTFGGSIVYTNAAQTITSAKTYTATQTFSAVSNPIAITTAATAANTDRLVTLSTAGNVTNSGIPLSSISSLVPLTTPVYLFRFDNTNTSSINTLTDSGGSTFSSSIFKYGTHSKTLSSGSGLNVTSALTALNSAPGTSFTCTFWFYISSTNGSTASTNARVLNYLFCDTPNKGQIMITVNYEGFAGHGVSFGQMTDVNTSTVLVSNSTLNLNLLANQNKWWFYSLRWDSSTNQIKIQISDGGSNTYNTSSTIANTPNTQVTTLNTFARAISRYYSVDSGTVNIDELRFYSSSLADSELTTLATATYSMTSAPNIVYDATDSTITGNKTFTGTTKIEKLYSNGLFARQTLTHSNSTAGEVTWSGQYLKWDGHIIIIPANKPELSSSGFITLYMPAVGQNITVFSSTSPNSSTLVPMTANGFDFGTSVSPLPWVALYYRINIGQDNNQINSNFAIVAYDNNVWEPDSTWILIAVVNAQNYILNWIPGMISIPRGCKYYSGIGKLFRDPFRLTATQTAVANATSVTVRFGAADVTNSANGMFYYSSGADPYFQNISGGNITCLITFNVAYSHNTTGARLAWLVHSSGAIFGEVRQNANQDSNSTYLSSSAILPLAPNEYFCIRAYQTSGTSLNVTTDSKIQIALL